MNIELIPVIVVFAFVCELVDSSLGMGYGTTLTPVLLLLGYEPAEIVPAVLFSEFVTGVLAGVFHQEFGNVNFRRGSRDLKVVALLSVLGALGVLLAVVVAVNVPKWVLKAYVGFLVLGIGLSILYNRNRKFAFSWKRISGLGVLAAFNKGMSGGGYGPVMTGGQVLAGMDGRKAVGITSLSEGLVSAVGFAAYLLSGAALPWVLAPSLLLGAVLSTPISAYAVSKLSLKRLTLAIGSLSTALGIYTLYRAVF